VGQDVQVNNDTAREASSQLDWRLRRVLGWTVKVSSTWEYEGIETCTCAVGLIRGISLVFSRSQSPWCFDVSATSLSSDCTSVSDGWRGNGLQNSLHERTYADIV